MAKAGSVQRAVRFVPRPSGQSVQAEQHEAQNIIPADHGNDPPDAGLGAGGGPREVVEAAL
ncbi:hypothetical protein CCMA1212_001075 [Trichoderma ghanense]|uniref:Uncharacterized protein n=1 Tax=Trichoderma ghanense TaxID=65468 RepID=A0ABY2HJB3_9HYPO